MSAGCVVIEMWQRCLNIGSPHLRKARARLPPRQLPLGSGEDWDEEEISLTGVVRAVDARAMQTPVHHRRKRIAGRQFERAFEDQPTAHSNRKNLAEHLLLAERRDIEVG